MAHVGSVRFRYEGPVELCSRYRPLARTLIDLTKNMYAVGSGGADAATFTKRLGDGTTIRTSVFVNAPPIVTINTEKTKGRRKETFEDVCSNGLLLNEEYIQDTEPGHNTPSQESATLILEDAEDGKVPLADNGDFSLEGDYVVQKSVPLLGSRAAPIETRYGQALVSGPVHAVCNHKMGPIGCWWEFDDPDIPGKKIWKKVALRMSDEGYPRFTPVQQRTTFQFRVSRSDYLVLDIVADLFSEADTAQDVEPPIEDRITYKIQLGKYGSGNTKARSTPAGKAMLLYATKDSLWFTVYIGDDVDAPVDNVLQPGRKARMATTAVVELKSDGSHEVHMACNASSIRYEKTIASDAAKNSSLYADPNYPPADGLPQPFYSSWPGDKRPVTFPEHLDDNSYFRPTYGEWLEVATADRVLRSWRDYESDSTVSDGYESKPACRGVYGSNWGGWPPKTVITWDPPGIEDVVGTSYSFSSHEDGGWKWDNASALPSDERAAVAGRPAVPHERYGELAFQGTIEIDPRTGSMSYPAMPTTSTPWGECSVTVGASVTTSLRSEGTHNYTYAEDVDLAQTCRLHDCMAGGYLVVCSIDWINDSYNKDITTPNGSYNLQGIFTLSLDYNVSITAFGHSHSINCGKAMEARGQAVATIVFEEGSSQTYPQNLAKLGPDYENEPAGWIENASLTLDGKTIDTTGASQHEAEAYSVGNGWEINPTSRSAASSSFSTYAWLGSGLLWVEVVAHSYTFNGTHIREGGERTSGAQASVLYAFTPEGDAIEVAPSSGAHLFNNDLPVGVVYNPLTKQWITIRPDDPVMCFVHADKPKEYSSRKKE